MRLPAIRSFHRFVMRERILELGQRTRIMGILNVTPDSFYDGGRYADPSMALDQALCMVQQGVDLIDVGGESTRPGSMQVDDQEEMRRVLPIIERLCESCPVPISIDTSKAQVAEEALKAGAVLVNDVTGLTGDEHMLDVVLSRDAGLCIMHIQGRPRTMQENPCYGDVFQEVQQFLLSQAKTAVERGLPEDHILLDPGIGFGKTLEHNLTLMARCGELGEGRFPVLIGPSRKSFIGVLLDLPVEQRLEGTLGAVVASAARGAHLVRVHDVQAARQALDVADSILGCAMETGG